MHLIERICHVALRTPDLEASLRHATDVLGLREVERAGDVVYLTCGTKHHDLQLIADEHVALDHIALQATGAPALRTLAQRLQIENVKILSTQSVEPGVEEAMRFVAPGGQVIEVHAGMTDDQPGRYRTRGVRPRKLGHVTLATPDRAELESFLERVLGFLPSDRSGEAVVWMRCNADHHGLAVRGGADAGLRHMAWEVGAWADLLSIADHLAKNGLSLTWGPGRHGPGNNLACYHVDPVGATHEYFTDLQQIHDDAWRGRDWAEVSNWRNLWGWGNDPVSVDGAFPRVAPPQSSIARRSAI